MMTSHGYYIPKSLVISSFLRNFSFSQKLLLKAGEIGSLHTICQGTLKYSDSLTESSPWTPLAPRFASAGRSRLWPQQPSCLSTVLCCEVLRTRGQQRQQRICTQTPLGLGSKSGFITLTYMHTDYLLTRQRQVRTQPCIS